MVGDYVKPCGFAVAAGLLRLLSEVGEVQRYVDIDNLPDIGIVEAKVERRGRYDGKLAGIDEPTFDNINLFVGRTGTGYKSIVVETLRDNSDIVVGPVIKDDLIVAAAET